MMSGSVHSSPVSLKNRSRMAEQQIFAWESKKSRMAKQGIYDAIIDVVSKRNLPACPGSPSAAFDKFYVSINRQIGQLIHSTAGPFDLEAINLR